MSRIRQAICDEIQNIFKDKQVELLSYSKTTWSKLPYLLRLSRLLATLLLLKHGYKWIQFVGFEHEIENRKIQSSGVWAVCKIQVRACGIELNPVLSLLNN